MSILHDFHMHSSFSADSEAPMEQMVLSAGALGLKGICFTEHMDADYPPEYESFEADPSAILKEISRLRPLYDPRFRSINPESGESCGSGRCPDSADVSVEIGFGLELGMQSHLPERYAKLARDWPFDFLTASQHLTLKKDPYYPEVWKDRSAKEIIGCYYEELYDNIREMKEWDTLSHLDYIIRYIPGRQESVYDSLAFHREIIAAILEYVIAQGKCLEVNSAGIRHGLGQPNPAPSILMLYRDLGGEQITIGSDAHTPEHIALGFRETEELLLRCGFSAYTVFYDRMPHTVPLL